MQISMRLIQGIGVAALIALAAGCTSNTKPLTMQSPDDPELKSLEADRAKFREKKVAVIEEVMDLNPAEHDAFWREYYAYENELRKIYDQRYQIIRDYAAFYDKMTNPIADNLAKRSLNLRDARNDLARKYYERIKKVTSAITAARFLQVENEITLLSDLKVSSETPIMQKMPKGVSPLDVK
jgi:hypothetical protein